MLTQAEIEGRPSDLFSSLLASAFFVLGYPVRIFCSPGALRSKNFFSVRIVRLPLRLTKPFRVVSSILSKPFCSTRPAQLGGSPFLHLNRSVFGRVLVTMLAVGSGLPMNASTSVLRICYNLQVVRVDTLFVTTQVVNNQVFLKSTSEKRVGTPMNKLRLARLSNSGVSSRTKRSGPIPAPTLVDFNSVKDELLVYDVGLVMIVHSATIHANLPLC